jgi:hypothetical protein
VNTNDAASIAASFVFTSKRALSLIPTRLPAIEKFHSCPAVIAVAAIMV